jgi:GTPase SAR1 family protein
VPKKVVDSLLTELHCIENRKEIVWSEIQLPNNTKIEVRIAIIGHPGCGKTKFLNKFEGKKSASNNLLSIFNTVKLR